jgi:uncharacterized protein YjiK
MKVIAVFMFLVFFQAHSVFNFKSCKNETQYSDTFQEKKKKKGEKKKGEKKEGKVEKKVPKITKAYESTHRVSIVNTWPLPIMLKEISGMTFISETEVACVQDEAGEIFIYDLTSKKISKSISFGGPGDYEGIAFAKGIYYVLKSDGIILKVDPAKPSSPQILETGLTLQNNCEGLYYDASKNRLLIAVKALDPIDPNKKGIFSFDLTSGKPVKTHVAYIDLKNELLADTSKKKDAPQRRYHPSDLAIDPVSKDFLIVNGVNSSLMILDQHSRIKTIVSLDRKLFPQPEGIAFSPSGKLYISSEGGAGNGIIAECGLKINP